MSGFLEELRRRKVVRTTAAYLVAAFAAAQGVQLLVDTFELPSILQKAFVLLAIAAIPIVIGLSWAFEANLDGVAMTDADAERGQLSWRRLLLPITAAVAILLVGAWIVSLGTSSLRAVRDLAVLPFENTGGDPADDYFSDGMRDELAAALARIEGLRIAGRTSSYVYKAKAVAAEEIGRTLRVDAIITGTVRRAGPRLRVTAQLVGTRDGRVMWDSVFESRSDDVFGVQDEFTRAITLAVMDVLAEPRGAAPDMTTPRGTNDPDAYDEYLRGRNLWMERGGDNVRSSIPHFREAVARDPRFARAHAGLALAYATLPTYDADAFDALVPLAEASARRALALDPRLPDAHLAWGLVLEFRLQLDRARAAYLEALALDSTDSSVRHVLGGLLVSMGDTERGVHELQRATRLDPFAKSAGSMYSAALTFARRHADAVAEARRVLALEPTFVLGLRALGMAYAYGGQPDSAIAVLERVLELHADAVGTRSTLAWAYTSAGRPADAAALAAELAQKDTPSGRAESAYAQLVLGNRRPILTLLSSPEGRAAWYRTNLGFGCNPMLDPLAGDAEYEAILRLVGARSCDLPAGR